MFCQFSAIRRQGCRRKTELRHGWRIEGGCVPHSTDTQNILEVLGFGILNKKNIICAFCQSEFANPLFDDRIL